jgi:hypothetical protein
MENASKAIIMAGAILISTLIVSIMIYLFAVFGGFSRDMSTKISGEKITQFNNNFEKYSGRIDVTAQEIVSIINFAKEYNDENQLSTTDNDRIKVYINGTEFHTNGDIHGRQSDFINDSTNNNLIYKCNASILSITDVTDNSGFTKRVQYNIMSNSNLARDGGIVQNGNDIIREIRFVTANQGGPSGYNLWNKERCIITTEEPNP